MIWIGSKDNAQRQLDDIYAQTGIKKEKQTYLKFCPNIAKLEKELGITKEKEEALAKQQAATVAATTAPVKAVPS